MNDWYGGIPPVCATNVIVKQEYPNRIHTIIAMTVPAGSAWFNHIPSSSLVPNLHAQEWSLKSSR
jgi:hypothetical protein